MKFSHYLNLILSFHPVHCNLLLIRFTLAISVSLQFVFQVNCNISSHWSYCFSFSIACHINFRVAIDSTSFILCGGEKLFQSLPHFDERIENTHYAYHHHAKIFIFLSLSWSYWPEYCVFAFTVKIDGIIFLLDHFTSIFEYSNYYVLQIAKSCWVNRILQLSKVKVCDLMKVFKALDTLGWY